MKILLVYPQTPETFWSFNHVLRLVSKKAAFPPLGLLTVAAMLPDDWELKLIDTNVERLKEEHLQWADYVLVSAMLVQRASVETIVARCLAMGKPVVGGGPLFTTSADLFPDVPHLVLGEAEDLMPRLVDDMSRGSVQARYEATERPDVRAVPIPRWDLLRPRDYVTMAVQFSRGCPYDCEFCDIVVMNGRVPRTKSPGQLIGELESLRRRGWKDMVFIVDDNFIGDKSKTKTLLRELILWRERVHPHMAFLTEASVNLADDEELCDLMARAGFRKVFMGIETPSAESLEECRKFQNKRRDLVETVKIVQRAGMEVMGGFIVGFDNDQHDIFKRQYEFIQRSGVVTAMVGLLTALPETKLYKRLLREGRLETESTGNNTAATLNFKPVLNREFLQSGYRELMTKLYEPRVYYQRIRTFLESYRPTSLRFRLSRSDIEAFLKSFWLLGVRYRGRRAYWRFCLETLLRSPHKFRYAIELGIIGHHFRLVAGTL